MNLEDMCRTEVLELHRFFDRWFAGALPASDETLGRFASVLASSFLIVTPDGVAHGKPQIVERVREAHGADAAGPIRIERHEHRLTAGDLALVTYEEWQERDGRPSGRISTALFRPRADTPNGVEWLHVHETALVS